MAKKTKRSTTVSIDFKGVQSRQKLPEDDYLVVVDEVNQTESSNGNDQLEFVFKVKEGKYEGNNLWFYCPLIENSLWKLHGLLTAMGIDVPDDEMDLDTEELVGNELMAVVTHETFEGTKRSKMTDFYPVEEASSSKKDEEEKPSKSKSSKKDEEEDDEDDEKEKPMTAAEKRRARREARKQKKGGTSSKSSKKDDPDDDDDDDKEEEKKPAKKDKGKKKPKLSSDSVQEMDEDDLSEVIEDYNLEVDLDEYKTLRKKAAAVVDALEAEDLLDD